MATEVTGQLILSVPLLAASLTLRPLRDEVVCDGVFGGEPQRRGVASPWQTLHLQGGGDLMEAEPASVLQLGVVDVQLGGDGTELTGELPQSS